MGIINKGILPEGGAIIRNITVVCIYIVFFPYSNHSGGSYSIPVEKSRTDLRHNVLLLSYYLCCQVCLIYSVDFNGKEQNFNFQCLFCVG